MSPSPNPDCGVSAIWTEIYRLRVREKSIAGRDVSHILHRLALDATLRRLQRHRSGELRYRGILLGKRLFLCIPHVHGSLHDHRSVDKERESLRKAVLLRDTLFRTPLA